MNSQVERYIEGGPEGPWVQYLLPHRAWGGALHSLHMEVFINLVDFFIYSYVEGHLGFSSWQL